VNSSILKRNHDHRSQSPNKKSSMNQTIPSATRLGEHLRRQPITPFIGLCDTSSALRAQEGSPGSAMTRDVALTTCNEVLPHNNLNQRATRAK
jgi:hypothetical protein